MAHYFIVSLGESNSGGNGSNASATAGELAPRPGVRMLNVLKTSSDPVNTYFEDLDIGTNNNLNHGGGLTSATHGWELQLANDQASGEWGTDTLYYIQTGQGGSKTSDWEVTDGSWLEAVRRINLAKAYAAANSITPIWIFWITIGLNDVSAGTSTATFKTEYLSLINRIKSECSGAKIVLTKLPGSNSAYDAKINEIGDSEANVAVCGITGCSNDGIHFDYAGFKTLSSRMTQLSQQLLGTRAGLIWSNFSSNCEARGATIGWAAGALGGANTKDAYSFLDGATFTFRTDSASASTVIYLQTTKDTSHTYPPSQPFIHGVFHDGFGAYRIPVHGTNTGIGGIVVGGRMRLRRSGNDLIFEKDNNNDSWTTLTTVTGIMSGVTSVYLNCVNVSVGATDTLFLTTPAGLLSVGESAAFLVGTAYTFSWGTSRYGSTVDIVLSLDGGTTFPVTIVSNTSNDGDYSYTPTNDHLSATAVIKLQDHASPGVFELSDEVIIATVTAGGGGGGTNTDLWYTLRALAQSNGIDLVEQ